MATQLWGTGGLTKEGQLNTFDKRLLHRFRGKTVFNQYGMEKSIPAHGGKSISFRRMEAQLGASYALTYASQALNAGNPGGAFASGPLPLTEGTPGAAVDATWSEVLATINQFGAFIVYSDLASNQSIDDITSESVDNFGEMMTEALDLFTRDVVVAGTNVQYASTGGSRGGEGSGMRLSLAELRSAKRTLLRNNVRGVRKAGGKLLVIAHGDTLYDLEGDANISNPWTYGGAASNMNSNQLFDMQYQDLPQGFRLVVTSLARIFPSLGLSGADVYATMVIGDDEFYGHIALDALPARVIRKDFGSAGTKDPLDQEMTIGWKAAHTAVRLNENLAVRIEHTTSMKNAA